MDDASGRDRRPWQFQHAKARFSEVVRRAVDDGPQHITVRGAPAVVVLSEADYGDLTSATPSIIDCLLEGDTWPDDLIEAINDRSRGGDREISF